jgi:formylglycine-generating enzyme
VSRWSSAAVTAALVSGALALGPASTHAGAGGKVIRIERAPSEVVEVPPGSFSMGLEPNTIELLGKLCETMTAGIYGGMQAQAMVCTAVVGQLNGMAMRTVFVSRFGIGRREVTTAEYRACVAAGGCSLDPLVGGDERYIRDEWPLVNVTWWEAAEYCKWRGGRLPTEAEWERAARGDDTRAWPWGDTPRPGDFNHGRPTAEMARAVSPISDLLGDPDDSDGALLLSPPGSYPWSRGPYGTLDQAGNVAEWVYDGWSENGYEGLPSANPVREPALFDPRVMRGGSWRQIAAAGRVDTRDLFGGEYLPNTRLPFLGFRCAWSRN